MKKILSLALAGMMLLSSLAASVSAADDPAEDGRYRGDKDNGWVTTVNAYALPVAPTFDIDPKKGPTNETLKAKGAVDTAIWGEPTVVAKATEANTHATATPNNNPLFAWEYSFEERYKEDKKNAVFTPGGTWSKLEYKLWLAWDNDYFYLAAEIKDPDGYSLQNGSASIWDGDALQFMIDPVGPNGVMKFADFDYDYTKTHFDWWTHKRPWSNLNCMLNLGVGDVPGLRNNRYQVVNLADSESGIVINDPRAGRDVKLNIVNADENTVNPGVTVMTLALPWNEIVDTASFAGNLSLENFGAGYALGMSATVLNAANPSKVPGETGKWNSYLNWGCGVTGASSDPTAPWFPYVNQGSNAVVLSDKSAVDNSVTVEGMRQSVPVKPLPDVDQILYADLASQNNNIATDVAYKDSSYNTEAGFATAIDMAICELDPVDNTRSCVGFWLGTDYSVYAAYDVVNKQFVLAKHATDQGYDHDEIYKRSDKTYDWQIADKANNKPAEWGRFGVKQIGDTIELYFNGELVLTDTNPRYGHYITTEADVTAGSATAAGQTGDWLINRALIMYNTAGVAVDNWVFATPDYNWKTGDEAKATKINFNYSFDTNDQAYNASPLRSQADAAGMVRINYEPNTIRQDPDGSDRASEAYYVAKAGTNPGPGPGPGPGPDDIKLGDVNGDKSINARDISAIMKAMLGNAPQGYNEKAADFNKDGTINARDISAIMKYILNGGK